MRQPADIVRPLTSKGAIRRDQRRKEIVEIAIGLFARYGMEGVALRQVAEAVGIPIGTLVYYFPEKEMLYDAAVNTAMLDHVAAVTDAIDPAGTAEERLRRALRAMLHLYSEMAAPAMLVERQLIEATFEGAERAVLSLDARKAIEDSQAHMRIALAEMMGTAVDDPRAERVREVAVSLAYGSVRLLPWYEQTEAGRAYDVDKVLEQTMRVIHAYWRDIMEAKTPWISE